jgi:hypothetical protein
VKSLEQVRSLVRALKGRTDSFSPHLAARKSFIYWLVPEVSPLATFSLRLRRKRKEFSNSFLKLLREVFELHAKDLKLLPKQ